MDQRCIVGTTIAPLAAPDYFLLELVPPPLRKTDRDKQTETEKRKSYHENRGRKSERIRDVDYSVLPTPDMTAQPCAHVYTRQKSPEGTPGIMVGTSVA